MAFAVSWLGANAGVLLALVAILVAWWIYRSQQSGERRGVLDGVDAELRLHASWVSAPYQFDCWPSSDTWWAKERLSDLSNRQPVPLVNRLSTVAIDAAIAQGPALFINPQLVYALVQYRQRAEQLNQLIDNAMSFQSSTELWKDRPVPELIEHFAFATAWIHWIGIGSLNNPENRDGAHRHFVIAAIELEREKNAGWLPRLAWFCYGHTWRRPKRPPLIQVGGP